MLEQLDAAALPARVCWYWPDREPEPVACVNLAHWLMHWLKDRACYVLAKGDFSARGGRKVTIRPCRKSPAWPGMLSGRSGHALQRGPNSAGDGEGTTHAPLDGWAA